MIGRWNIGGCALLAVLMLCAGRAVADEVRTWTSAAGARLEARLVEVTGESLAVLEAPTGRRVSIRLDQLSEADRAFIAARAPPPAAEEAEEDAPPAFSGIPPPPKRGWLPAFTSGPYAGHFAAYESPLYIYVVNTAGGGALLMKDASGRITGPAVPLRPWRIHYTGPDTRPGYEGKLRSTPREVKALTGPAPAPMLNPDRIEVQGVFDDDVTFKQTFEFSRDAVRLAFEIRDPPRIQYPTRGGESGFGRFLATDRITGQTPLAEQKRFFEGWGVTIRPVARGARPRTITFWESLNERPSDISQATIRGPWGERSLDVRFTGAPGRISVYTGRPIWEGFSMGFSWLWADTRRAAIDLAIR